MSALDLLLRGIAVGAVLATGFGFLRGGGSRAQRWVGAVFCLSVAAYAINSCWQASALVGPLAGPVWVLSAAGTAYFWLFALTLFEDRPFVWERTAPIFVMTAVAAIAAASPPSVSRGLWVAHNLLEIVLVLHVLRVVARSWGGDLVEARRRFRGPFMLAISAYCLFQSGFEIAGFAGWSPPWWKLAEAASVAVLTLAGAGAFMQTRSGLFDAASLRPKAGPGATAPADSAPASRLAALMAEDEIWRREGLTIGALAEAVGLPEHRLRRLINQDLGHRNFADFLNQRRIEAAKAALADPGRAREPISSLAFDLGYASLGPFNRAFKEATGETPTAWRAGALGGSPIL